jgi:hypothetical protein
MTETAVSGNPIDDTLPEVDIMQDHTRVRSVRYTSPASDWS